MIISTYAGPMAAQTIFYLLILSEALKLVSIGNFLEQSKERPLIPLPRCG